jgi:hypothetical protein
VRDEKTNALITIPAFEKFINRAELERVTGSREAAE